MAHCIAWAWTHSVAKNPIKLFQVIIMNEDHVAEIRGRL